MPVSPLDDSEGPVRVTVTSEGRALAETVSLISVTVRRALNRVPSATLVIADGDMPEQSFPVSDGPDFKPGAKIVIKAGYADAEETIFEGLVIKHALVISGDNDARLTVECRDEAVKMTVGRKNAQYVDKTDKEVMQTLIGAAGLTAALSDADTPHQGLIQHYCTDWDFMLARAEANGCVVVVTDGNVVVGRPQTSGSADLTVGYGDSLLEFDAELDSRHQFKAVQARAWSLRDQALLLGSDEAPVSLNSQGNINSAALAEVLGLASFLLQTGAPLPRPELDAWAKAQQLKSGLSRLRGSMRFQGSALAKVGGLIELKGVGQRFNGSVYVTGLTHQIADGAWSTKAEFGTPPEWFTESHDVMAPSAAGLIPGIEGLHVGVVLKLDADPGSEHRIQVKVPTAGVDSIWARVLQFYASNAFGAVFVPEVGDEVLLGWFNNDPGFPVVLGSLYSSKNPSPQALTADNDIKAIVTRCKAKLEFNDKDRVITLETPGVNKIVISDKDKSIVITDQHRNKIELGGGGIILDSPKDIKISAKGAITIDAVGALTLKSQADAKLQALNVHCEAQIGLVAKGSASAELSASGQTTVKGALVMIN